MEAGLSMTYAERQADTIKKLSIEFNCIACTGHFPRTNMVATGCGHRYCAECARTLFMEIDQGRGTVPSQMLQVTNSTCFDCETHECRGDCSLPVGQCGVHNAKPCLL